MNLNNGDSQQNIQINYERHKTRFSLIVTIVEVHTLNLDICMSLHDPVQIILHTVLKAFKILKQDKMSCSGFLGLLQSETTKPK